MSHRNVRMSAHKVAEVACYRAGRPLVGCVGPSSKGVGAPHQCPRVNQKPKWRKGVRGKESRTCSWDGGVGTQCKACDAMWCSLRIVHECDEMFLGCGSDGVQIWWAKGKTKTAPNKQIIGSNVLSEQQLTWQGGALAAVLTVGLIETKHLRIERC